MEQHDPIVIAAAKRTAIGSFNGTLSAMTAPEIGRVVLDAVIRDAGLQPNDIDDVIMGQVLTGGAGMNPARQAAMKAGIPIDKTALTINQVCGSGLRSVALGMQSILSGDSHIVIAGGQENMSLSPHVAHLRNGTKMGDMSFIDSMIRDGLWDIFNGYHMGVTAENVATHYQITRADQDAFAATSQQRAEAAIKAGKFVSEIVAVKVKVKKEEISFDKDEFPRAGTTAETLGALKPAFKPDGGTVTAGNASGINDGAAAVVLMRLSDAKKRGIKPLAVIKSWATAGVDPAVMGTGPIPASRKALNKAGWNVNDLDVSESNEAFAAQAIAVTRELGLDPAKTNINGGAIALGHPIGASGTRVLVTLLYELARRNGKRGLATLCIGGGMGIAMCVERVGDIDFRDVT